VMPFQGEEVGAVLIPRALPRCPGAPIVNAPLGRGCECTAEATVSYAPGALNDVPLSRSRFVLTTPELQ